MLELEVLVLKLGAVDGLAPGSVVVGEVTTLNTGIIKYLPIRLVGRVPLGS